MIFTAALLLLDMFGLQVERIGDVTKDGVDELVVTDPCGDRDHPREGRVLVVDPARWAVVRELTGGGKDSYYSNRISVARSQAGCFMSVVTRENSRSECRVRVFDASTFVELFAFEVEARRISHGYPLYVLCVADLMGPALYFGEQPANALGQHDRLEIRRHDRGGESTVGEIHCATIPRAGPNLCPKFDEAGLIQGLFVSLIPDHDDWGTRYMYPGNSRIDYLNLSNGAANSLVLDMTSRAALGVSLLPSGPERGWLAGDVLAVSRTPEGDGRLIRLTTTGPLAVVECAADDRAIYWGTSMCWIRDVDGDGSPDLAIGNPEPFGGEVLVLGSKTGARIASVPPSASYGFSFGTNLCSIADQDGDGLDDLAVSCVSVSAAGASDAALSIVSTRTWTVTRVLYEKDLVLSSTPK